MSRQLEECGRAVFRLLPSRERYASFSSGSCFSLEQHARVITAAHVIADYPDGAEWLILADHWRTTARVLDVDPQNDLAVLQLADPAPTTLQAAGVSSKTVEALAAWDWPDAANPTGHGFRAAVHFQLGLRPVPADSYGRISFVGHVRRGMSGGPLVSLFDGRVHGVVVSARPDVDEHEVVESWWSNARKNWQGTPDEESLLLGGLRAQLALGFGLAASVEKALRLVRGAA